MILRLILSFFFLFSLSGEADKTHYLVVTAIFKDESRFLREWIEFYKVLGVEHFYLYNNLSDDDYLSVLTPYVKRGEIDLIEWPFKAENIQEWNQIQCSAYKDALSRYGDETVWMAFLDTDEFLFPLQEDSLNTFLKEFEPYGSVSINWQCYGHNFKDKLLPNELLIEAMKCKAETNQTGHLHVKSIVKPEAVLAITNPHYCKMKPGFSQVTTDKTPFTGPFSPTIDIRKARINHYWTRDIDFMENVKIKRQIAWGGSPENTRKWGEELSQVEDLAIYPILYRLKHALSECPDRLH